MNVLITGNAGFIGMHLTLRLCELGYNVFGIDNLNEYYDVKLKFARLKKCGIDSDNIIDDQVNESSTLNNFRFIKMDINNPEKVNEIFRKYEFEIVCHLAAQAGVRYSIINPRSYIENNIDGFFNIIEASRVFDVKYFFYASSSSVYGNEERVPFSESMNVDKPVSLYAATKKCNELIAHSYSEVYGLKTIGLRFFTVYGPWGRPDMAYFSFTDSIINCKTINIYNEGKLSRDFTYIDDIIDGITFLFKSLSKLDLYDVYNIGNNTPIEIMEFVKVLEKKIGKKANMKFIQMQNGDVKTTFADTSKIAKFNYSPKISINIGLSLFVDWYLEYFKVLK